MGIRKYIRNKVAMLSLAMAGVEKNALGQMGEALNEPVSHEKKHVEGTVLNSLKEGKITQEVRELRWRMYKVLQESEGITIKIIGYDADGMPITKSTKKDYKKALKGIKLDSEDSYGLEMVVDNTPITKNTLEWLSNDNIKNYLDVTSDVDKDGDTINSYGEIDAINFFNNSDMLFPLIVEREFVPKFEIERFTKKLNVRVIDDETRMLEFCVSLYPDSDDRKSSFLISELKKAMENKSFSTFLEIDNLSFITNKTIGSDNNLLYEYKNIKFDRIVTFNGFYIVKYIAEISTDGLNILDKFKEEELDKKYENKERRKQ